MGFIMRLYIKSCRIETSTAFQNNIENPILTLHNQYDHKVKKQVHDIISCNYMCKFGWLLLSGL